MNERPSFQVGHHNYVSAGIIPFTLHNDNPYYLMSFRDDKQRLEDFGGKSAPGDSTLMNVALREYEEENNGKRPITCDNIVAFIPVPTCKYMIYFAKVNWDVSVRQDALREPGTDYDRHPIWITKETIHAYTLNPRIKSVISKFH
jgi:hypothetical protein